MKIRTRLSFLFTFITGMIFIAFAWVTYLSASANREVEFYNGLSQEAITRANLILDVKVDAETMQTIYYTNREVLYEVEIAIYDTEFNLLYHDAEDIDFLQETPEMINEIAETGEIQFTLDNWQAVGLRLEYDDQPYVVTAAAFDESGFRTLANLRWTLFFSLIGALSTIFAGGWYFSRKALQPVSEMLRNVKSLSARNLDLRLNPGNGIDELGELAVTFNDLLARLERSFESQKNFVSNVAHELHTPLTAIITELELEKRSTDSSEEHYKVISSVLNDAKKLAHLFGGLMDLAKTDYDKSRITFRKVRLDEILMDASSQVLRNNASYKVEVSFTEGFDTDKPVIVEGNEYLLRIAFLNLMENGCKFSESGRSEVAISSDPDSSRITFRDDGVGIPEDEMDKLFVPFFRGKNQKYSEGNGIGLSLTNKIVSLHNGSIEVQSSTGLGSSFVVKLPLAPNGY